MSIQAEDENIIVIDAGQAFEEAFERGLKDADGLMYMYTKGGKHFFKDSSTRKYSSYSIGGSVESGNTISNKDMAMLRSMISTELSDSDSANSISDKDMALIKSLLSKSANSISDRDAALVKELITGRGRVPPKAKGGQVGYMGGGHVKMKGYKSGGKVGYSMAGTGAAVKGTGCKGLF